MSKLWWAIAAQLIGSIVAFFQLQGWVVWNKPWLQSIWWMYATSLIIAPLFFWSTKLSYEHFGAFFSRGPFSVPYRAIVGAPLVCEIVKTFFCFFWGVTILKKIR